MIPPGQSRFPAIGLSAAFAAATLDDAAHEIYIADGYLNKRVMVYDWDTGKFKRGWGAYGKPLAEIGNDGQPTVGREGDPTAKDFKSPVHCVRIAKDGFVYVAGEAFHLH